MLISTAVDDKSASAVHPTCCRDGADAARHGHLACLRSLVKQGTFYRFHGRGRAGAGEARNAQTWLAALAACDARQPDVLKWLLAGGWPLSETERLPWHSRDVADPSLLTWYTERRPWQNRSRKAQEIDSNSSPPGDGTAIDWDAQGEWCEMVDLAGLRDPPSETVFRTPIDGCMWGKVGACENWFPQEFQVLWRACRSGDFACQRVIVEAGCRSRWVTVLAALTGQLQFLNFAIEQGCPCDGPTLVAAAAGGHVDTFKHVVETWFDEELKIPFSMRRDAVADGGQHWSPDWFFSERFEEDYRQTDSRSDWKGDPRGRFNVWVVKAALAAAENGHVGVLQCIMARKLQILLRKAGSPNPASAAVSHGRLPCLELAYKYNFRPDSRSVELALENGHVDCMPFLISHRHELTHMFSVLAAKGGHLELLELQAARDELDYDSVATGAAMGGQLACLRFALEKGELRRSWDLLDWAVEKGHVSCMQYLHEKGYRAEEGTLSPAVRTGSLQCLKYNFEMGCVKEKGVMVQAARRDVALVKCLHEQGCPWEGGTTVAAARRGCLATLQYCHEHGCPWDAQIIEAAILGDSAACLQYIHTHDCPPLPRRCPPAYNVELLQYAVEKMGTWGQRLLRGTGAHLQADDQHRFADWRLLMYLSLKWVALPLVLQWAAELRLARFETVVCCFHLATRLADHGGPHAPMWAAMGLVPQVVLEQIARLAHLKL